MYSTLNEPKGEINFGEWEPVDLLPEDPPAHLQFPLGMERLGTILHISVLAPGTAVAHCGHVGPTFSEVIEHWCLATIDGADWDGYYFRYRPADSENGLLYNRLVDALEGRNGITISSALPELIASGLLLPNDYFR
jgi:hypothetical protein